MSEKGMNGYEELRKYFVSQLFQILNDELGLNVGVYEDMLQGDDTFMNTTELLQTRWISIILLSFIPITYYPFITEIWLVCWKLDHYLKEKKS